MRASKKLTMGAIITAMGVVFMTLGAYVEVLDLSVLALASLLMVFMCIEVGAPYNWLTYAATATLGAVFFFSASPVWILYLFIFGLYPIIKGLIERLKRWLWIPLKLLWFNFSFIPVIILAGVTTGTPIFATDGIILPEWVDIRLVTVGLYVVCNVGMILFDAFLNSMIRFYLIRLRPRFASLLK